MKKIGIIGGLGPEATSDYYLQICHHIAKTRPDLGYPEIVMSSINMAELLDLAGTNNWDKITDIIVKHANDLVKIDADFIAIASNTPHKVFNEISEQVPVPMLSIVKETRDIAVQNQHKNLLLLGTQFTMSSHFFADVFAEKEINITVPNSEQQQYIHEKIFTELEFGIVRDETRNDFLKIIDEIAASENIDGVILGCTEFPLILQNNHNGIPFLDTTSIHIKSIINFCINN